MKLFLFISFFTSLAFASNYNYKSYWSDSGYVKADKNSSFKVLLKRSPLFANSQIAVMTLTQNNNENKNTVINLFKTSVGKDCKWRFDFIDGLEIHECASLKTGALFRLAYNDKTQQFSTGSVALRYLMPTYAELHLLQTEYLTGSKPSAAKKSAWLIDLLMQKAFAQNATLDLSKYINITGTSILGNTNGALNNIAGAGNNIADSVNNASGAANNIAGSVNNASGAANNIAGSINNASGAANNIAGSINNASSAANNIAGAGNNIASAGNNLAATGNNINNTVKDTLNAKNIAKLSAIAGVTFGLTSSLGSMAANFLVNGTYSMLRTLFYEAKGEFTPEQKKMRLERFEKSLKTFQELEPALNDMASKLAIASAELTLASGVTQEEFLAKIDQDITNLKENRTEDSSEAPACTEEEKALKIRQLEDFKKIVIAADKAKPKVAICENIESLYKNWANAEYALLNSRRLIMQDLRLFNGTIIDGIESQTNFQENRKLNNACLDSAESKLSKVTRELNGKNCDDDISSILCQKYEAYKGMVESCREMANQKFDERDDAELVTATSNVTKVLAQFSRELGSLSCDGKTQNCTQGKLDRVRTDIKDIFVNAAKQCPQFFFAKQLAPRTPAAEASPVAAIDLADRSPVAAAAVEPKPARRSIWSQIKNFFDRPKQVNTKAAEEVVAGGN